jgi:hypothetical protein
MGCEHLPGKDRNEMEEGWEFGRVRPMGTSDTGCGSAVVVRWKSGWGCERLIKRACRAWGRLG